MAKNVRENDMYKKTRVILCQKPLEKSSKYSRNETIFKIGHLAKAMAHAKVIGSAKWSLGVKNLKCLKTRVKRLYKNTRVVLCKRLLEGTPNIREMRPFGKSATLQRL